MRDRTFDNEAVPQSEDPVGVSVWSLSTRPDIVDELWAIGRRLPQDCCWIAYRRAVLAHPETGVIFGLAIGSFGYALRICTPTISNWPAEVRYRGLDGEETFSLARYGPDWRFVRPGEEVMTVAKAAYDQFGERKL